MAEAIVARSKTCTKCGQTKPAAAEYFSSTKKAKSGLRAFCKSCVNLSERKRREANPEEARERGAKWYAENKALKNEASARWYAENKSRHYESRARRISADPGGYRKYWRDWQNHRYSTDPRHRINTCISSHIRKCLKGRKGGKSWQILVGYSLSDLIDHLERQFQPGMTWENFGEWHVDHIVPKAAFEFDGVDSRGFKSCWALENLRPLWASENMSKGAKLVDPA